MRMMANSNPYTSMFVLAARVTSGDMIWFSRMYFIISPEYGAPTVDRLSEEEFLVHVLVTDIPLVEIAEKQSLWDRLIRRKKDKAYDQE